MKEFGTDQQNKSAGGFRFIWKEETLRLEYPGFCPYNGASFWRSNGQLTEEGILHWFYLFIQTLWCSYEWSCLSPRWSIIELSFMNNQKHNNWNGVANRDAVFRKKRVYLLRSLEPRTLLPLPFPSLQQSARFVRESRNFYGTYMDIVEMLVVSLFSTILWLSLVLIDRWGSLRPYNNL